MVSTLSHYDGTGYKLHAYVIMPDHLHLLITPAESVEKSVQLIKGGFSFRAKRELEWNGEIWQPGFTDHRIRDEEDWHKHLAYIQNNPVNAHLTSDAVHYEFMGLPSIEFPQGLKPADMGAANVRAEARTLQPETSSALSDAAKQAAEKGRIPRGKTEKRSSGPKGPIDYAGFMRGLKPPPPSGPGFSAACKAVPFQGDDRQGNDRVNNSQLPNQL
jgi:putative transposase